MATITSMLQQDDAVFPWDATLALVRWKQTRRGYDNDAQLIQTGFELLAPQSTLLDAAERAFNVSWHRIVTEAVHFAIFLLTKARRDDTERPEQTTHGLRLLRLALNVFATREHSDAIAIPMNSSNLLLAAMADVLERASSRSDERDVLLDVTHVFHYLFGLATADAVDNDSSLTDAVPTFQLYKPPTNVFAEFLHRALTASFTRLAAHDSSSADAVADEYVALMHALLRVFHELQRSQVNKKKVFLAVAKTSLRDFIGYRHALTTLKMQSIAPVVALLDRIVVDALFDVEHIRAFDGALVHTSLWRHVDARGVVDSSAAASTASASGDASKSKKRRKHDASASAGASALVSYQKNLFDELKAFLSDASVALSLKSAAGGFMQVLVSAFALRIRAAAHEKIEDTKTDLKTSKKRAATVIATASTTYSPFKFWAELCAVAFLAVEQLASDESTTLLVTLYEALFDALCAADVYRVTEDTDEREQFDALETILKTFVHCVNARDGADAPLALVQAQCATLSSAVRCSPNLVSSSLVAIFELVGGHARAHKAAASSALSGVLHATGTCVVDLVQSYESMRLLDKFLHAMMATDPTKRASEGLYTLVAYAPCEAALRKAFLTLPPGQLDVLWTQFTHQCATSSSSSDDVYAIGLARFVFQLFLQEVHVTPQTKSKVASLVLKTHAALFAPIITQLMSATKAAVAFTASERELFALFGELLSFYDVLPSVCGETFDVILSALKQCGVSTAMDALLETTTAAAPHHSLDSTGIIKLCIFWLRKATSIRHASDVASTSASELKRVALLVVDHVIASKCWDAVAFYLPELLDVVSETKAAKLLRVLVTAYVREETDAVVDGPATRIVREAAFYEIRAFQAAAPSVLSGLVADCADSYRRRDAASLATTDHLFALLSSLPPSYLDVEQSGDLLVQTLGIYEAIALTSTTQDAVTQQTLQRVLGWLQAHFKRIAIAVASTPNAFRRWIDAGVHFVFEQAVAATSIATSMSATAAPSILTAILSFYLDDAVKADAFVGNLLRSIERPKASRSETLLRSARVVEALADLRLSNANTVSRKVSAAEHAFIASLVTLLQQTTKPKKASVSLDESTSFVVLGALVKYRAATNDGLKPSKATESSQAHALHAILSSELSAALALAMDAVVRDERPQDAWQFYVTFCHHFGAFRPSIRLESFGCLLAVALALVTKPELSASERSDAHKALQALVAHANKDESRLLLATLTKEVKALEPMRAVSALKALCLLLQGDRKLSSARRELLEQHKDAIVAALIENFSRALAPVTTTSDAHERAELCTYTLQVFVLFFSKAELFSWKTHELAHVFIGFQPLLAATAHYSAKRFTRAQIHEIWMLSYTLLLRVVRHHFASLVNGTPHIIQATNALLELLVVASNDKDADSVAAAQCAEWSSNLARLYGYMKEHDAQLRKHVVYLMLSYLLSVTRDSLSVALQQKLRPGVYTLLDICSTYEKEQLYAALDSTGKSLLKSLDTSYKLTHRYVGKV